MTKQSEKRHGLGMALVLLSGACWVITPVLSKIGLGQGLDEITLNTARLTISGLIIAAFLYLRDRRLLRIPGRPLVALLAIGAIDLALGGWLFLASMRYLDAALATLLMYTFPAFVVLLAVLTGQEKLRLRLAAALALTFVGVAMVLEAGFAVSGEQWFGVALVSASALLLAVYMLAADRLMRSCSAIQVSFFSIAGGALAMLVVLPLTRVDLQSLSSPPNLLVLAGVAVIGTSLATIFFFMGIRHVGAAKAAIITTAEPVMVVLAAWLFLGETLSLLQLVGVGLQLSGLLLVRADRSEPAPF